MTRGVDIIAIDRSTAGLLDRLGDPEIFDGRLDAGRVARYVATPGHRFVVAVADGVVVGQACAMVQRQMFGPDALFVDNLGVARTHRRRGIATALWHALVAWGREEGCGVVWVATQDECTGALALYKSLSLSEGSAVTFETDIR